jgi:protein-disulfide isomerase
VARDPRDDRRLRRARCRRRGARRRADPGGGRRRRAAARAKARSSRRASPRVLAAAAGIVALAVVGVVLAVVVGGGKSGGVGTLPTTGSLRDALPGAASVRTLLHGIPQRGLELGSRAAPVTLTEYVDLQCPYCREFETQVMPDIVRRYVRSGKVKVSARVLAFIGSDSTRGRKAMIAAGEQGKAFDFAQLLYDNQGTENTGWLDDAIVADAAKSIPGLNPRKLFAARDSAAVERQATAFDRRAAADGVTGTPTFFVAGPGAARHEVTLASPTDEDTLLRALDAALGSKPAT